MAAGGPADEFDYELSRWTEVPYLFANGVRLARLAYEEPDVPNIGAQHLHVFFELGDHLGSTSVVLDKATGELVERATYQAYGSAESDYRPDQMERLSAKAIASRGRKRTSLLGCTILGSGFLVRT